MLDKTSVESLPMTPGIYRIYRIETGQEYVGSSVNIRRRLYYHLNRLMCGKHHARHFQAA